jgi:hypothetical protein
MFSLAKILHVLAVGLWFGGGIFFTFVVGLSLFDTFEKETAKPSDQRPFWLPAPTELEKARPSDRFPDPLRKEQGSRIAGAAVGPMFLPYYVLQVGCGVVALLTALAWLSAGGAHKLRAVLLLLALAGAGAGWWLEREVEALRQKRSETSDVVLTSAAPSAEQLRAAEEARARFGTWHTYSLFANFGTLALVTVAMGMAAFLPPRPAEPK